jgi:hypothetical protein
MSAFRLMEPAVFQIVSRSIWNVLRLLVCCSSKRKGFDRDLIHARSLLDRGLFDRDTNGPAIDLMKQNLASASISLGTDSPQSETDEFDFEKTIGGTDDMATSNSMINVRSQARYSEIKVLSTMHSVDNDFHKEEKMAPLFLFLASSFNIELVYVILKGITQFGYFTCDNKDPALKAKIKRLNIQMDEAKDKATLRMNKIKVKDYKNWETSNHKDFTQDGWITQSSDYHRTVSQNSNGMITSDQLAISSEQDMLIMQ